MSSRTTLRRSALALLATAALAVTGTVSATARVDGFAHYERTAGADRYATSAQIAGKVAAAPAVVYIASGETFPDALTAAADAGAKNAPVLLSRQSAIPDSVLDELKDLTPGRIVLVGGTAALSENVLAQAATVAPVNRVSGTDRYDTAAKISSSRDSASVVYIASGEDFPDALAGASVAGSDDAPVLLTRKDSLPASTAAELDRLNPTEIVILGGTAAVSGNVRDAVDEYAPTITRISGDDRYETAAKLSVRGAPTSNTVYLASGTNFPDALSGAALAASKNASLLLVRADQVPESTCGEINRLGRSLVSAIGGTSAISDSTLRTAALGCFDLGPTTCEAQGDAPVTSVEVQAQTVLNLVGAADEAFAETSGVKAALEDLADEVRALRDLGAPRKICETYYLNTLKVVEQDLSQASFDVSLYERSGVSYNLARDGIETVMDMLNGALHPGFTMPQR